MIWRRQPAGRQHLMMKTAIKNGSLKAHEMRREIAHVQISDATVKQMDGALVPAGTFQSDWKNLLKQNEQKKNNMANI